MNKETLLLGIIGGLGLVWFLSKKQTEPPPSDELPTPSGNYLTGRITNAAGLPISDVKLQLFNVPDGVTVYTNSNGEYIFNDLIAQHYSFNLEKTGYKFYLWGYTIDAGANSHFQVMEDEPIDWVTSKIYNGGFRVAQAL